MVMAFLPLAYSLSALQCQVDFKLPNEPVFPVHHFPDNALSVNYNYVSGGIQRLRFVARRQFAWWVSAPKFYEVRGCPHAMDGVTAVGFWAHRTLGFSTVAAPEFFPLITNLHHNSCDSLISVQLIISCLS
jgi:hypothetical protein